MISFDKIKPLVKSPYSNVSQKINNDFLKNSIENYSDVQCNQSSFLKWTRFSYNDLSQHNLTEKNDHKCPTAVNIISSSCDMLSKWAVTFNVSHKPFNGLLKELREHSCSRFKNLPKDARTVVKTKTIDISNKIWDVYSGHYYHFGIEQGIQRFFPKKDQIVNNIRLAIGTEGLPISDSNTSQLWPILGYIIPYSNTVFPIGIYSGTQKPSNSNDFIHDFIEEAKILILNGIITND